MSGTDFYYEPQVRLAEELARIVPIDGDVRTFFAQLRDRNDRGGAEARAVSHEAAGRDRVHRRLPRPVARRAVADREQGDSAPRLRAVHAGRLPRAVPGYVPLRRRAPTRCAAECLAFITDKILVHLVSPDEIGAIVVEPIQGEGGYIVPPKAFLQGLRELATRHGMVLVVDEVQSGMGRTGKMFASEHFDLKPDVVNIAKGIASGLPLGVTCARADIMTWPPGAHASTFGGNPVACAAANATIALLQGLARRQCRRRRGAPDGRAARAAEEASDHRRRARQGPDDRRSSSCAIARRRNGRPRSATPSSRRCSAAAC